MDGKKGKPPAKRPDTGLRRYSYDPGGVRRLFAKIIESLSRPDDHDGAIGDILVNVCRHFKFGGGFVYEADHTRAFTLKERYAAYAELRLPEAFKLEERLDPAELRSLLATSVLYRNSGVFDANTVMMVAALNADGLPIGLAGMVDRRRNILLDAQAVEAATMVLNLLANHVKLRIYQRNLQYAEQSLVGILDNTGVDVYVNDFHTREIIYVNKSMAAPYGGVENMLGKKCWEALYADKAGPCDYCPQEKLVDEEGNPTKIFSWDYRRPFDGSWFRVLSAAFRWVDGRLAHVVSSVDITENKNNEATIARMANFDALTNLPNRRKLMRDAGELLARAAASGGEAHLLFFDLDNFKKLNDGMGHRSGDLLLAEVGRELQTSPHTANRAYRYGGDEFIVLFGGASRGDVRDAVRFLQERFRKPWRLGKAAPVCRASIGVASFPSDAEDAEDLIEKADLMMYRAKRHGRGTACFFDGETLGPAE